MPPTYLFNQQHRRTSLELLAHLGIEVDILPMPMRHPEPSWTGTRLLLDPRMRPSDIFHEAAHWILAPPERRGLENYGLGQPGAVQILERPRGLVVSGDEAQIEEEYASILGIALEYHLGSDWLWTYDLHQWHTDFVHSTNKPPWLAIRRLVELEQRGIVRDGWPAVLDTV